MKPVRYFFATSVLASALSMSAFAGTIHTGAPQPEPTPTPTPAEGEVSTTFNGNIHTGDTEEANAGEAVAADVLSLVQVVLSLL
jgi:hypothetical protein